MSWKAMPMLLWLFLSSIPIASGQDNNLFTFTADADLNPDQQKILSAIRAERTAENVRVVRIDPRKLSRDQVTLNVAPDVTIESGKTDFKKRGDKNFTWVGNLRKKSGPTADLPARSGEATMVVRDKNVTGNIVAEEGIYEVRPLGNGMHAIIKRDQTKFPRDEHPPSFKQKEKSTQDKIHRQDRKPVAVDDKVKVNILVAYTPAVKKAFADIDGFIQLAVDESNRANKNSGVKFLFNKAHTYQVKYNEDDFDYDTVLEHLEKKGDRRMDQIHTLRNTHKADVVVLLFNKSDYCGLASDILAKESSAFAVVHYECATGYYSFAHEIGHLMGVRHDEVADPTDSPFKYGHGYRNLGTWRTIMAYDCDMGCQRLPYWSNPTIKIPPDGEPGGTEELNNEARVLNETARVIANFRK